MTVVLGAAFVVGSSVLTAQAPGAARGGSRVVGRLSDSTFWPEGMDVDPRTGSYYLASIRHRTIAELRADGTTHELWPRGRAGFGAVMGVRVDTARGVLWATMSGLPQAAGYVAGDSTVAALLRIRIADGTIERRWDIPLAGRARVLGDLAIGPRGDVYVTDSFEPVVFRLRPGSEAPERITDSLFRSLQGVAATPDGGALYVADYSRGILRVDLATGRASRVADSAGVSVRGCDGIALDRSGAIVAVQNGVAPARVVRIALDATGTRILGVETLDENPLADEPTIGTIAGGEFVYVANSQWEKYDARRGRRRERPLTPPLLLGVPLAPR